MVLKNPLTELIENLICHRTITNPDTRKYNSMSSFDPSEDMRVGVNWIDVNLKGAIEL